MHDKKRLSIDKSATKEAYTKVEMHCIGMIIGEDNPADVQCKVRENNAIFNTMVSMDSVKAVEWLLRETIHMETAAECEGIESKNPKHQEMIEASTGSYETKCTHISVEH